MKRSNPLIQDILSFLVSVVEIYESGSLRSINRTLLRSMYGQAYSPQTVSRAVSLLKHRGYVREQRHLITLTPKGLEQARRYKLDSMKLDATVPWDGRWRLVIWDVPESQHRQRDQIRRVLRSLGFMRIQQSIWITPYPCHEVIDVLRTHFGLQNYLVFLEAVTIEDEEKLRAHFRLTPPLVAEKYRGYHGDSTGDPVFPIR